MFNKKPLKGIWILSKPQFFLIIGTSFYGVSFIAISSTNLIGTKFIALLAPKRNTMSHDKVK